MMMVMVLQIVQISTAHIHSGRTQHGRVVMLLRFAQTASMIMRMEIPTALIRHVLVTRHVLRVSHELSHVAIRLITTAMVELIVPTMIVHIHSGHHQHGHARLSSKCVVTV
jgi:hypothetical protein